MSDLFNKLAMRRKGEAAFFSVTIDVKRPLSTVWICRPRCVLFPLQAYPVKVRQVGSRVKRRLVLAARLPGCQMSSHRFPPLIQQQTMTTGKHNMTDDER